MTAACTRKLRRKVQSIEARASAASEVQQSASSGPPPGVPHEATKRRRKATLAQIRSSGLGASRVGEWGGE